MDTQTISLYDLQIVSGHQALMDGTERALEKGKVKNIISQANYFIYRIDPHVAGQGISSPGVE